MCSRSRFSKVGFSVLPNPKVKQRDAHTASASRLFNLSQPEGT